MRRATVLLDNEAVQALRDVGHRKHRRAVALLAALLQQADSGGRTRAKALPLVPTAVRVEAGWDRTDRASAVINAFSIIDVALDPQAADQAATTVESLGVSVADAHLAATAARIGGPCVVLTSDVSDMSRIAATLGIELRPVPL